MAVVPCLARSRPRKFSKSFSRPGRRSGWLQREELPPCFLQASSQKLAAGQRTRLQWNNGSAWPPAVQRLNMKVVVGLSDPKQVCCLMDEQARLLYCVASASLADIALELTLRCSVWHEVTSLLTYPERQAYQLLYGLPGFDVRS